VSTTVDEERVSEWYQYHWYLKKRHCTRTEKRTRFHALVSCAVQLVHMIEDLFGPARSDAIATTRPGVNDRIEAVVLVRDEADIEENRA